MNNVEKGKLGEIAALMYLKAHFYKILEHNYRTPLGEIDIIAKKGSYIIFIEVKYRKDISKGYPREAVTAFKQNQIKKAAMQYIQNKKLYESDFRFDVIEILGKRIEHIKDAFW